MLWQYQCASCRFSYRRSYNQWNRDATITATKGYDTNYNSTTTTANFTKIANLTSTSTTPSKVTPELKTVTIAETPSVKKSIEDALDDVFKQKLNNATIFALDISFYTKGTLTKVQPNTGTSVTITCHIQEGLIAN